MDTTNSTRVQAPKYSSYTVSGQQSYDSVTLKPSKVFGEGRVEDDTLMIPQQPKHQKNFKKQKIKKDNWSLLSCRKNSLIGTLNVRTAREPFKRLELVSSFIQSNLLALGIQEHRAVHDEEIKIEKYKKGVHLITSSAWRNSRQAATGGVGVMVTKAAYKAVSLIKSYGKRILLVSFNGNPKFTIMSVYSPTESASEAEAEDFHNSLRSAIKDVPLHHLLLVVGDLNAHLSKISNSDT